MELPHPRARRDIGGACGLAAEGWGGPQERHGGGGSSAAVPGGRGGRGHLWITLTSYIYFYWRGFQFGERGEGGGGGGGRRGRLLDVVEGGAFDLVRDEQLSLLQH